jgi:cytochrome c553
MNSYLKLIGFVFFTSLFIVNPASGADLDAGKEKAEGVCAGCHGKDGVTAILPSYPIIAGQHQDYLTQALHDYKSGARNNAVMSGIASTLSNEDIINISAYFSTMPSPLYLKKRQ